ncbi:MAG TPA: HEPN domain-containing protein [Thermoanaerobaculia bacterium]|nr:HEPN domain-containing protein [Thermoanaerobaculia bacterium]
MTRSDLRKLTRIRLAEARILLRNRCYEGAYYLAGYAVECAIKACIAKRVRRFQFPDKKIAIESHTHDLKKLLGAADIRRYHEDAVRNDPDLDASWEVLQKWSEQARYQVAVSRKDAEALYAAIVARKHGVLAWVKQYW